MSPATTIKLRDTELTFSALIGQCTVTAARALRRVALSLALLAVCPAATAATWSYQVLTDATRDFGGASFSSINHVALSNTGRAAFSTDSAASVRQIFTPERRVAGTGDVIGGTTLSGGITSVDINDSGAIVFTGGVGVAGSVGVFTPDALIAAPGTTVADRTFDQVISNANINNAGTVTFMARSSGQTAIYTPTTQLATTVPGATGDQILSIHGGKHTLNDAGDIAFEGRRSGGPSGRFTLFRNSDPVAEATVTTIDGVTWGGGGVGGQRTTIGGDGTIAWFGRTNTGSSALFSTGGLIAETGTLVGGMQLRDVQDIAVNGSGQVAWRGRGQVTSNSAVLVNQDTVVKRNALVLGKTAGLIGSQIDINDAGQVLFSARLDGVNSLVLATPHTIDYAARLRTGSPSTLSQVIDTPATTFELSFEYLFETLTGSLEVLLGGQSLGTLAAPAALATGFSAASFVVDGALLGQVGLGLEFLLDGPTGSSLLLDNIFTPGLANHAFQTGDLTSWQTSSSGAGFVRAVALGVPVPAPGSGAAALFVLCGLLLQSRWRR